MSYYDSAAMNTGVHVSFRTKVLSGSMPKSRIARAYGNSIFSFFEEPPYCFPWAKPIYIPTNSVGGFPFLHTQHLLLVGC